MHAACGTLNGDDIGRKYEIWVGVCMHGKSPYAIATPILLKAGTLSDQET